MAETTRVDVEKSRVALKEKLQQLMPAPGTYPSNMDGLALHRFDGNSDPSPGFYQPVIIVVAQGRKRVRIGAEEILYGEHTCFVAGVNMPAASCVVEATADKPYLSLSLELDKTVIADLVTKVSPTAAYGVSVARGAMVQDIGPELLDAFLRLLELAEKPERDPVMSSLLFQEIHYRLLTSPFGNHLRLLNTLGSQSNQITRAISWLKDNFKEPLSIEALAGRLNMAPSTFHKHFKELTTLSPLQYQKRLRLSEAQRLMLTDGHDATQAAFAVGYESATQFNREYKRLFGESPRKDVVRMKHVVRGEEIAASA